MNHFSKPVTVYTVGVYGSSEEAFFAALRDARVQVFFDIRDRRGLRGARYAYANSRRLQDRLAELGIRYVHRRDLAPSKGTRELQKAADKLLRTQKRVRVELSLAFITAYRQERLERFEATAFLEDLAQEERCVALFCVEREPEACHRSLVAKALVEAGAQVRHLRPCSA